MGKMQYKKIELFGTNLSQFKSDRNPLASGVFVINHKESLAIKSLLTNWINARHDDNYKLSQIDFLINLDEANELIEKLKTNVHYEKI